MNNFLKDIFYKIGVYRYAKTYLKKPQLYLTGLLFQISAKTAIIRFIKVMETHGYPFWLEFGTLLGAIREQKLISHDKDIDVAMRLTDWDENLEQILRENNFKLMKRARLLTGELIEETYKYKTAKIDIFYAHAKGNKIVLYDYMTTDDLSPNECIRRFGGLIVYENILDNFDLMKHPYYHFEINVPVNYQEHLRDLYGEDYMVPNKKWRIESRVVRKKTDYYAKVSNS